MIHARSTARRPGIATVVPTVAAAALALAPSALAAETATATFGTASCSGKHSITVTIKNPQPESVTFTVRVDGPNVASPNSIVVPADASNSTKLTLPDDATTLTVSDNTNKLAGTTKIECSSSDRSDGSDSTGSDSSSDSSGGSSQGSSSGASSSPTSSASSSAAVAAPAATKSSGNDHTRKLIGFGIAGLGVVLAAGLLFREFK